MQRGFILLNALFSSFSSSNPARGADNNRPRNEPIVRQDAAEQPSVYGSMTPQGFEMSPPDEESIQSLMVGTPNF